MTNAAKYATREVKRFYRQYVSALGLRPGGFDRNHMRYMGYAPIPLSLRDWARSEACKDPAVGAIVYGWRIRKAQESLR